MIRIFSPKEGCRKISEIVTKLSGGSEKEYEPSKDGKLAHYHHGRPLDKYGRCQHCYVYCYFEEPSHDEPSQPDL